MKKSVVILLFIFQLALTSCTSSTPLDNRSEEGTLLVKNPQDSNKIIRSCVYHLDNLNSHLSYLTSEECEGRLVGTEGNRLAGEYIKNAFEEMGLESFFDNFYDEYPQTVYPFEQQTHLLTVIFKDGSEKTYTYGTDYLERNRPQKVEFKGELTDYDNDSDLSEKAFLLGDFSQYGQVRDKVKAVFLKEDDFFGIPKVYENGTPIIQITNELYNDLKYNKVDNVHYKSVHQPIESTQNNVVGMIKGKNADKAIIISAHFDHVGQFGETLFAGAVDNGSGVAVLLEAAKELKARSTEKPFESDIIFCAFNGEEEGLKGSKAFLADMIGTYKSLANINIDCVGLTNGGPLIIEGEPQVNTDLAKIIESLMPAYEYPYKVGELGLSSDHETFIDNSIPALNLGQQDVFQDNASIHTEDDDMDVIDNKYLHDIVHLVIDSVAQADEEYFEIPPAEANKGSSKSSKKSEPNVVNDNAFSSDAYHKAIDEMYKIEKERKDDLKYDEYLFLVIGEYYGIISGNKSLSDVNELHGYYPDIAITESIGDYAFNAINIMNDEYSTFVIGHPYHGDKDKHNKILKRTFNYSEHTSIVLNYKKENEEFTISINSYPVDSEHTHLDFELERYDYTEETTESKTIYWLKNKENNDHVGVLEDYKTDNHRFIISVRPRYMGTDTKESSAFFLKEVIEEFYNLIDMKKLLTQLNLM